MIFFTILEITSSGLVVTDLATIVVAHICKYGFATNDVIVDQFAESLRRLYVPDVRISKGAFGEAAVC